MDNGGRDLRLALAVTAARGVATASRKLGRGGGTAAPGLVADRLDPGLLGKIASRLQRGSIVVAGTNGKTTTSRMIADILEADGARVVHNRSGSNLVRGVAAAFAAGSTLRGDPKGDAGVIEADEAAFPEIVRRIRPDLVLLNNLFRDQLDRYGELAAIANLWRPALEELPPESCVVVNADDPALAALTSRLTARVIAFGMQNLDVRLDELPHAADSFICLECGAPLEYEALYLSHLGEWHCAVCGNRRPELAFRGSGLELLGEDGLSISIADRDSATTVHCGLPGLYNAYNVLAAAAVTQTLGIDADVISRTLAQFRSAFGRIERLSYRNRQLTIALVKNPVGFNEVLRMLLADGRLRVPVMIVINDLDADGRDVSWLWDVDFEQLAEDGPPIATAGIRGTDMANRLKYAGVADERIRPLGDDLADALEGFVASVPEGGTAYILPTYTAMLRVREILAGLGAVERYWRQ